jgi:hypothetical protein
MSIDIENWIKELQKINVLQKQAIKNGDNFKLAACFLKLAKDCKENSEWLERNGQLIIKNNLDNFVKQ